MVNFSFIQKFQELELDVAYTSLIQLSCGTLAYSEGNESSYENYILVNTILNENDLSEIEKVFDEIHRSPAFFFEETEKLLPNKILLKQKGYTKEWKDTWLFYEKQVEYINEFASIRKVTTSEEMEIFLKVFDSSYQENDPQNPYGSVKIYLESNRKKWLQYGNTNRLQYFIVYDKSEPVAVSILTSFEGLGYISGIGSLQKVRGKGFGKLATLYAIHTSQQQGNAEHFLLTEEGTFPHEFYKRVGFVQRFSAVGMYR